MSEYMTIEWATMGGVSLQRAHRMTEAEAERYSIRPYCMERMLVGAGERVALPHITSWDLPDRAPDGEFMGGGNRAWILDQAEAERYTLLNAVRKAEQDRCENAERRAAYLEIVSMAKEQGGAMTEEEAAEARKRYNNTYNEGGYGYVPHYVTRRELDAAEAWLKSNTYGRGKDEENHKR